MAMAMEFLFHLLSNGGQQMGQEMELEFSAGMQGWALSRLKTNRGTLTEKNFSPVDTIKSRFSSALDGLSES